MKKFFLSLVTVVVTTMSGAFLSLFITSCNSMLYASASMLGVVYDNSGNRGNGGNAYSGGGNNLQQQFLQGYANNFWSNYNSNPQQYQNVQTTTPVMPTSSNTSNKRSNTAPSTFQCPYCSGTGRVLSEKSGMAFGLEYIPVKCNECGKTYNKRDIHTHYKCSKCNGTGRMKY